MDTRIHEIVTTGYSADSDEICEEYFEWLTYVVDLKKEYSELARVLHNREFYSMIHNDENRVEDGKMLRNIFKDETLYRDYSCLDERKNCSMLEMLVALAIRMESILEEPDEGDRTIKWFWEILDNLGLSRFTNYNIKYGDGSVTQIQDILDDLVERRYSRSGKGGLFPLKEAKKDQRKTEIWYQLSAYLLENYVDRSEICG